MKPRIYHKRVKAISQYGLSTKKRIAAAPLATSLPCDNYRVIVVVLTFALIISAVLVLKRAARNTGADNHPSSLQQYPTTRNAKSVPYSDILPDYRCPLLQSHATKVRGVSFKNRDGSDRETLIREFCSPGDAIAFVREPDNQYDSNAIAILRAVYDLNGEPTRGEQLGYVPRELAQSLAPRLDSLTFAVGEIESIAGDIDGQLGLYVGLSISIYEHQRFQGNIENLLRTA